MMRLDKMLCDIGIASRSELRQIIKSGRVTVDGVTVAAPEKRIDCEKAHILLDGRELRYKKFRYYMMDKPEGVLSATEDPRQKTVLDLLDDDMRRMGLFICGICGLCMLRFNICVFCMFMQSVLCWRG